jgi:rhamnose utilization protein RhaD (predicted bifunctional aldolase and dehydrogenase)/NAD(P)-dependent dehydrogenase (short-subunit alcohol dehydrogenase family)
MESRWDDGEARRHEGSPLALRVYTSRLLGQEPDLVLHGGGNTSVKAEVTNLFGEAEEVLWVKGSGWDLATIQAAGFAPVRMDALRKLARLERLTDGEMVRALRGAMLDPGAPTPSVEAILHGLIPFRFVDHTHADAVVTLTNTPGGEELARRLLGERVLVLPYVMPGFVLARQVHLATRDLDWRKVDALVLAHHGVLTFSDDARQSYQRMLELVSVAERHLAAHARLPSPGPSPAAADLLALARLRRAVSRCRGAAQVALLDRTPEALAFCGREDAREISGRGPLTPDHVIRTKRTPLFLDGDPDAAVAAFAREYRAYFERHARPGLTCLSPAPCWAAWPGQGCASFGSSVAEAGIVRDIVHHTTRAIQQAERLGGWRPVPERDLFEVEYWELEQAKLKTGRQPPALQGKIALVTGAARGIGRACVEALSAAGAAVAALDLDPGVEGLFRRAGVLERRCDVTDPAAVEASVAAAVERFGGLDLLVCNAGILPPTEDLEALQPEAWSRSLAVNLTANQVLLKVAIPFLKLGVEASAILVASRNALAPGPGAGAYSVAKAGLTQLGRVAALELAPHGVRVNTLHPDGVYDTGIWTPEVLAQRAARYGLTVEQYKTRNLLKTEITSRDVAALVCELAGPAFAKTTGAQIPVDGGNDRVI